VAAVRGDGEPRRGRSRSLRIALVAAGAVLALSSCRSGRGGGTDVAVPEPVPDVTPVPPPMVELPVLLPEVEPPRSPLEVADEAFEARDFGAALDAYRSHLDSEAAAVDGDRVLFRLAVLQLMNGSPARDAGAGYALLRRLVREHPESAYRAEAELILGLTARVDGLEDEIERLETQLEALKSIDLGRPPDRRSP